MLSIFTYNVNGLTCAYRPDNPDSDLYLLDLTTYKSKKLPKYNTKDDIFAGRISLGLGLSKGPYKVVRLFNRNYNPCCEVLTIGVIEIGKWRFIGEAPCRVLSETPVFAHGALHWMPLEFPGEKPATPSYLLEFDIVEEKFRWMKLPIPQMPPSHNLSRLDVQASVRGLCISYFDVSSSQIEVRIPNGKYKSAANRFIVDMNGILNPQVCTPAPLVIGIADGEVLVHVYIQGISSMSLGIYCYDLLHKTFHSILDPAPWSSLVINFAPINFELLHI